MGRVEERNNRNYEKSKHERKRCVIVRRVESEKLFPYRAVKGMNERKIEMTELGVNASFGVTRSR